MRHPSRQSSFLSSFSQHRSSMFYIATTHILFHTTTIRLSSSSPLLQFFSHPNCTLFGPFLHTSFKPLPFSFTPTTSFSFNTMTSSNAKSVHDFTIKDANDNFMVEDVVEEESRLWIFVQEPSQ
ncbi:hypothetical protein VNO78_23952 [Psophocarpus tetragonolobus]|uniref:Uncharacterized protein n=1 Tax=Psophocarpus tetragonolobus TaxID=3891 RepID=A0AAN9S5E3_PSOTE